MNQAELSPNVLDESTLQLLQPLSTGAELKQSWITRTLSQRILNRCNEKILNSITHEQSFSAPGEILKAIGIDYEVTGFDSSKIPSTGPLVLVANHPTGLLDGFLLLDFILKFRPDFKWMANALLKDLLVLRKHSIFVDNMTPRQSKLYNKSALSECKDWVNSGHVLGVFPSGEVSHFNLRNFKVAEGHWKKGVMKLIRETEAPVLPIYIQGNNSFLFHALGLINPRLRTIRLGSEVWNKKNAKLKLCLGPVQTSEHFEKQSDDISLGSYLKSVTYAQSSLLKF